MSHVHTPQYRSPVRAAVRFILQRILFRAVVNATIRTSFRIDGNVRSLRGPFLIVANHTSHLDAPVIAQGLPARQARYLAAGVAYDYFFTAWHKRWFVRWLFNAFPIYRDGSRSSSAAPRALLAAGVPILLFPEGGRQVNGKGAPFKPGTARLAIEAGLPIIPTAVVGGYEAMPKGRGWPLPGRPPVHVEFGEPLWPSPDASPTTWTAEIEANIAELYDIGAAAIGVPTLANRHHSPHVYGTDEADPEDDNDPDVTTQGGHT